MLSRGEQIVKVACPDGCVCDGNLIPPGTTGMISTNADYVRKQPRKQPLGSKQYELYYRCSWNTKPLKPSWWTYEHGIQGEDASFPDISYLEGV